MTDLQYRPHFRRQPRRLGGGPNGGPVAIGDRRSGAWRSQVERHRRWHHSRGGTRETPTYDTPCGDDGYGRGLAAPDVARSRVTHGSLPTGRARPQSDTHPGGECHRPHTTNIGRCDRVARCRTIRFTCRSARDWRWVYGM